MARARNIKPGFFRNEDLSGLPHGARLLFAGLWTIADREGRLEHRPRTIKAEIFPFENVPIEKWLGMLAELGFVQIYECNSKKYIAMPTWRKHQNPHIKEMPSTIPAPYQTGARTVLELVETGTSRADSLIQSLDSLIPLPGGVDQELFDELQTAFDRHLKHDKREPRDTTLQTLMGMSFDRERFRQNHRAYCEFWTRKGWNFSGLSFLQWILAGCPPAPQEPEAAQPFNPAHVAYVDPFKDFPRSGKQAAIDAGWESLDK